MSDEKTGIMIRGPIGDISANSLHLTRVPHKSSLVIARRELKECRIQTYDSNRVAADIDCRCEISGENAFFNGQAQSVCRCVPPLLVIFGRRW
jgi:hypothetical protein